MRKTMKILVVSAIVLAVGLCLFGCSGKSSGYPSPAELKSDTLYWLNYSVPSDWSVTESRDSGKMYKPSCGGLMMVSTTVSIDFPENTDSYIEDYFDALEKGGTTDVGLLKQGKVGKAVSYEATVTRTSENNEVYKGYTKYILNGHALYGIMVVVPEGALKLYDDTLKKIIDSMSFAITSPPLGAESGSTSTPKADTSSAPTASQTNALKMAKSYLGTMAFSYTGLIEQLEYEKFSAEDAAYGADNCGANWNAQAAKMAKSYLDTMAFSRDGLIEQLMYEGFTEEQAVYGVDSVGL